MLIYNNKIKKRDSLLSLIFVLSVFFIPFNNFGCSLNQMLCVCAIFCSLFSTIDVSFYQFAFFLPYISATAFPMFGINFHTISILEFILLVRLSIMSKKNTNNYLLIVFIVFVMQSIPMLFFEQGFDKTIKLALNLLLFYVSFFLCNKNLISEKLFFISFTIGILGACIGGLYYKSPVSGVYDSDVSWLRYKGIWTDPNFLGMFCLIGIIFLFHLEIKNYKLKLLSLGSIAALFYFASMTMSRTFLFATAVCLVISIVNLLKKNNASSFFLIMGILLFLPYFFDIVNHVNNVRVDSEDSLGNGRIERTMLVVETFLSNPFSFIFGIGFDNLNFLPSQGIRFTATHNSYADIITQFGVVGFVIILSKTRLVFIKRFTSFLFSTEGIPFFVLLFYGATLSLLPYEFTYVIAALTLSIFQKKDTNDSIH